MWVALPARGEPSCKIRGDICFATDEPALVMGEQESFLATTGPMTSPRPKGRIAAQAWISPSSRMTPNFARSRRISINAERSWPFAARSSATK
jgi:hypothetical protein